MITLILNDKPHTTDALTLTQLISSLSIGEQRYAVEVDQAVIPKHKHDTFLLVDGMTVEIITAVGGG